MRLVHSDTSALSQTHSLSVRALTWTRVPVSCTPLGFTVSYSHKIWDFFKALVRGLEQQNPLSKNTHFKKHAFQFLFWYMRPGTVFYFSITECLSFTGTRQRPGNIILTHLYIDTGIIFKHLYTFTCLLWWLRTQQIGSTVMSAAELSICMQSLQSSSDFCPPVVRQRIWKRKVVQNKSLSVFDGFMLNADIKRLTGFLCEPLISVYNK